MCGLLWFMQNDEQIPEAVRRETRTWGFCADEFADNDFIPYELYVREARRMVGQKTFTALDAFLAPGSERAPVHEDSVGVGDYHVDSHIVQRKRPDWPHMEGHVYLRQLSKPAQIPFGVMLPVGIDGLLVPGALSATHLGFSVLRMEPPWMALGQAAGTAAHLAVGQGKPPSQVPVRDIQRHLLAAGQVISFFYDVPGPDPIWRMLNMPFERTRPDPQVERAPQSDMCAGMQYLATKGYFNSYYARPNDPVTRSEAARWMWKYMQIEAPAVELSIKREQSACPFSDLTVDHADYDIVMRLWALGLADCWRSTGGFYPAAPLSRLDAMNVLLRLRDVCGSGGLSGPAIRSWEECLSGFRQFPAGWSASANEAAYFVTRGQFCELLYDLQIS
jgi:hypothetical protein